MKSGVRKKPQEEPKLEAAGCTGPRPQESEAGSDYLWREVLASPQQGEMMSTPMARKAASRKASSQACADLQVEDGGQERGDSSHTQCGLV